MIGREEVSEPACHRQIAEDPADKRDVWQTLFRGLGKAMRHHRLLDIVY